MFQQITPAPPDAILGLSDAFREDPNPKKINLGVGVYKDADGRTPVLPSVKAAEERLYAKEATKSYLPIDGSPAYGKAAQALLFGANHPIVTRSRAATAQTPGGTGALRVAADFLHNVAPHAAIWLSDPTWDNHRAIFQAAGMRVGSYPYYDAVHHKVDFGSMMAKLEEIPSGDVVLLHGCCHNPTGMDLNQEQWRQLADLLRSRELLPLIDFAYQGFAAGLEEDAQGIRTLAASVDEFLICSSFSKNFGLYNERAGALTLVAQDADAAEAARSHIKKAIRVNYSNPPAHGGLVVETVLTSSDLRQQWEGEVTTMRNRINDMRHLFVETLNQKGVTQDFSFITQQRGMFSFSGLTKAQVERLRREHAIYIVGSGRINVAGMTTANMDHLCESIAAVVR
jgi:aspartate/tyrosine/aromatic aminotransferase